MKKSLSLLILSLSSPVFPNALQYFAGISYNNPAELVKVKSHEYILGTVGFDLKGKFTGESLNFNTLQYESGTAKNHTQNLLPYGRIAKRLNEGWVVAVDVTQPFHSSLDWGDDSITRYAANQTLLRDYDISPKIAHSFSPNFHLAGGININYLAYNEMNWSMPSGATTYAKLTNKTSSTGIGFNVGLSYIFNPMNIFGLSYYSQIRQNSSGYSEFNGTKTTDHTFHFHFPATTSANFVHIFNQKWLMNAQLFYTQWDINQYINLINTAAPPPSPQNFKFMLNYRSSLAYLMAVRKQQTDNLGLTLVGMIDNGPERDSLRVINFPSDVQYFLGLSADYKMNETTTLQLTYGHAFSKTRLNNTVTVGANTIPFSTGDVKLNGDIIDLRLKVSA